MGEVERYRRDGIFYRWIKKGCCTAVCYASETEDGTPFYEGVFNYTDTLQNSMKINQRVAEKAARKQLDEDMS